MFFIRLLRLLRGYIRFCAWDGFPERFLNLCAAKGIPIWDVKFCNGQLSANTTINGYKAMREPAKKAAMRTKVQEKYGLPFFTFKYRKRVGLVIGMVIFLSALGCLSQAVWSIDVLGNNAVAEETIREAFAEEGLHIGLWRNSIDAAEMAKSALGHLPGVSWCALNLRGSTAEIVILEEDGKNAADTQEELKPVNIIASKTGVLRALEVYAGKRQAKVGQAVVAGTLLSSGVIENADGSTRFVQADAYAEAETQFSFSESIPRATAESIVDIRHTGYVIRFLWFSVPIGTTAKPKEGELLLQSEAIYAPKGKSLPLSVTRTCLLRLKPLESSQSNTRLKLSAAQSLFDDAYQSLRFADITDQKAQITLTGDTAKATWRGDAIENIAVALEVAA
ncbi:MAG: sporulation protein YqfD [Oscillospiraceae bacterium]|jgi:similar to stage IV sporulation protein|nr:sporulation protein YqfD [Oscillospiraceae bacterium]